MTDDHTPTFKLTSRTIQGIGGGGGFAIFLIMMARDTKRPQLFVGYVFGCK